MIRRLGSRARAWWRAPTGSASVLAIVTLTGQLMLTDRIAPRSRRWESDAQVRRSA
jgi:hypothetical protein